MTPAIPYDAFAVTTEEDRRHLCTYAQAYAAAPDSPNSLEVNGRPVRGRFQAMNETTGRGVFCADVFILHGYVAASRALRKNEAFSMRVGGVRIDEVEHHPDMLKRLANPNWSSEAFANNGYCADESEQDPLEQQIEHPDAVQFGTDGQ